MKPVEKAEAHEAFVLTDTGCTTNLAGSAVLQRWQKSIDQDRITSNNKKAAKDLERATEGCSSSSGYLEKTPPMSKTEEEPPPLVQLATEIYQIPEASLSGVLLGVSFGMTEKVQETVETTSLGRDVMTSSTRGQAVSNIEKMKDQTPSYQERQRSQGRQLWMTQKV